ncbi:lipoyltransferase [Saitoella complicata NRRL Y-17804]|nr:lipoyltransferase [Saitoella complicata NRRL Y-17804]ODQ50546.1 lipoyltransferase [Saitoella complicata NRRL Y-17804]
MTMQMEPTYTCGRRERGTVSEEQRIELENGGVLGQAKFVEAQRGGQTTFHGPGQMVAYPIIDLKSFNITPRCYVSMLEKVLISLFNSYSISAQTTENTGVWTDEDHKIAAIGIHVRRNITSHGIALNIDTNLDWFRRIVACGLPDKQTTTMKEQLGREVSFRDVEGGFVKELARKLHCNIKDIVTVPIEELDAGMDETAFTLAVRELLETRGVLPTKSHT